VFKGSVALVLNNDGRAEACFAATIDLEGQRTFVFSTSQASPGAAHWNKTYQLLSPQVYSAVLPRLINPPDGKLTALLLGGNEMILHVAHHENAHAGGPWRDAAQSSLRLHSGDNYSLFGAPIVCSDNRLAFFFAKPGGINVTVETAAGSRTFTPYADLFGFQKSHIYSALEAARNQDGRLELHCARVRWHSVALVASATSASASYGL